jgi:hypothetical protein
MVRLEPIHDRHVTGSLLVLLGMLAALHGFGQGVPPAPGADTQSELIGSPCPSYQNVPGLAVDDAGVPFIANIQLFLDTCPNRDPNLSQILNDFQIRLNGVTVNSFPCSEPVSAMPVAGYTDPLIYLQVLRVMYYMDRGQTGHLPWTPGSLYDWMKSKIGGVNIVAGVYGGYCCDTIGGRVFFVGGTHDDANREFDKTWRGISNVMAFAAHERRHLDGAGFPHSSCCGIPGGCDDTFNTASLAPYAVQWWLEKCWLEGQINVGVGCLGQSQISEDAQWRLSGANNQYRSRFCSNKPALLTVPASPGGSCPPRQCQCPTVTLSPASLPAAAHGIAYLQSVVASGGAAPYSYVLASGSLPTGLTLSAAGVLSGVPTATGTFSFSIRATDAAGCSASRAYTLWVDAPSEYRYWLQVASHAPGANRSQWRTDLGLLNPGKSAASAQLRFHATTGVVTHSQRVAPGQQVILRDVVDAFAVAHALGMYGLATVSGSAALEVVSDRPLKISSRTYNLVAGNAACYPQGTLGQNYDAFATEDGIARQQSAYLPQLVENAAYRTNIALTNTGSMPASVTVDLFNGAGTKLTSYDVELAAGQYKQENRPFFNKAGQTHLSQGWAWVQVRSGSGILASASVVDNKTNDPTTLPALRKASTRTWLQVASHGPGANQSLWRTDLGLLNVDTLPLNVQVRFHSSTGVKSNAITVAPRQQAILVDVVNQIPATGSAALEIVADRPVWVSSRTYNLVARDASCYPNGTFGQNYDAFLTSNTLGNGTTAYLTQLQENHAYRTNIALTNTGNEPAKVTVTLYNGAGTQVGQYTVDLAAGQYKQENKPFATKAGQTELAAGYARVYVTQGSGIIASASVVDNVTNDPTTMPAL